MKGAQSQTVTTTPDAATNAYVTGQGGGAADPQTLATLRSAGFGGLANRIASQGGSGVPGFSGLRPAAIGYANTAAPINPALTGASSTLGGYGAAGLNALGAQTDPTKAAAFMNPYTSAMDPVFAKLQAQAIQGANSNATSAGAFGGSRAAVAQGQALSDIANQEAGFNYQGFNDAMNRALQTANLGLGATGLQANLGQYLTNLPLNQAQQRLQMLLQGIGPYGTTQSQQMQSDPFSQLLGAGITAASLFGSGGSSLALNPAMVP